MRHCNPVVLMALAALVSCPAALEGAIPGYDGDEECHWESNSLIVARVVDNDRDPRARKYRGLQDYVTLDPKMTLAGTFDCAGAANLRIPIVLGPFGSPLFQPPPVGSLVVVHIELANEGYFVPGYCASYMPESLPAWEIGGVRDVALAKIVTTVGERRREGARKDRERQADCAGWLKHAYPKHAEHLLPLVDDTFKTRSIVFCRIKSVEPQGESGETKVALRLIGTLAGRLDPALVGEVDVTLPAQLAEGRELPWRDAEMCVVLDHRDGKYVVAPEALDFMPSGWAFSPNETRPDALIDKILANLRKRRPNDAPAARQ